MITSQTRECIYCLTNTYMQNYLGDHLIFIHQSM
jgi:hypothetical protein